MPEIRETRSITGRPALIFGRDYSRRKVTQCRGCGFFCSVCSERGKCCLKGDTTTTTTTRNLYPDTDTPEPELGPVGPSDHPRDQS